MIPLLFQGEEWAASTPFQYFTDLGDRGLAKAVTNGRRQEFRSFGWPPESVPDPQDPETFQRSRLDWDEIRTLRIPRCSDWYRALIALRRATPALRRVIRMRRVRGMTRRESCCCTRMRASWSRAISATTKPRFRRRRRIVAADIVCTEPVGRRPEHRRGLRVDLAHRVGRNLTRAGAVQRLRV